MRSRKKLWTVASVVTIINSTVIYFESPCLEEFKCRDAPFLRAPLSIYPLEAFAVS